MRYLSRVDLEMIGLRIISAYKRLPAVTDAPLERVDIDYLMQSLLGLRIDYRHLSPYRDKLGLNTQLWIRASMSNLELQPIAESLQAAKNSSHHIRRR